MEGRKEPLGSFVRYYVVLKTKARLGLLLVPSLSSDSDLACIPQLAKITHGSTTDGGPT